jgi:hypothetical protein
VPTRCARASASSPGLEESGDQCLLRAGTLREEEEWLDRLELHQERASLVTGDEIDSRVEQRSPMQDCSRPHLDAAAGEAAEEGMIVRVEIGEIDERDESAGDPGSHPPSLDQPALDYAELDGRSVRAARTT